MKKKLNRIIHINDRYIYYFFSSDKPEKRGTTLTRFHQWILKKIKIYQKCK